MGQPVIKQPPSSLIERIAGQRIVGVRRLEEAEMKETGWHKNPVVIVLQDGTLLVPQSDEEGNDGGALLVQPKRGRAEIL